jgi:hypothetical protein
MLKFQKKHLISSALLFSLILFSGCSSKQQLQDTGKKQSMDNLITIKKESYGKGYKDAIKDMSEIYVRKGFNIAKDALKHWKDRILSIEAGKYAIEEGKITAPELTSIEKDDGSIKLEVVGCKMERENTPSEILEFYYDHINLIKRKKEIALKEKEKKKTNRKSIKVKENKRQMVTTARTEEYKLLLPADYTTLKSVNKYGVDYVDKDNQLELTFKNKEDRVVFCNETGLCE